ncbi:hypothetical protein NN561_013717 [Cricetulus griseus]
MRSPAGSNLERLRLTRKRDRHRSRPERPRPHATPAHRVVSPSLQTPSQVGTRQTPPPRSRTKSSCVSSHKAAAGSTGSRRWGGKPPPPPSLQCTHLRLGAVSPVALHAAVQSTSTPVHAAGATSPSRLPGPLCSRRPPPTRAHGEGRRRAPGPLQELRGRYLRCRQWRWSGLEPVEERSSPPPPTPPTLACCGSAAAPTARAAGRQHRSQESRWRRREGGLEHGGTPPYRPAAASVTLGRRGPAVCSRAGRRGLPGGAPGGGAEASSPRRPAARVCPAPPPLGQRLQPGVLHWASRGRLSKFADTPRGSEQ